MKYFIYLILFMVFAGNAQTPTTYFDGSQWLIGQLVKPAKPLKSKAGILILPAWKGITDHEKQVAQNLAKMGYFAFIADIYGEGNYPDNTEKAGQLSGYYKKNCGEYQKRIQLALDALIKSGADANQIAAIGYCFGGTGVLEAARANLKVVGVASFHGGLGKNGERLNQKINTKVLILHGADDPHVPKKDIAAFEQEMRESDADWQMIYYADAVHAFTEKSAGNDPSKGAAYNAIADQRSWEHLKIFLKELFPQ